MPPVGALGFQEMLGAFGARALSVRQRGDGVELGLVLLADGVAFAGGVGADTVCLGAGVYLAAAVYDYRRLRGLAPSLYVVMLVALLAVHLVGHTALGARRWLSVAGFPLEPSELSKLMLVIVLAAYLSRDARITWRAFAGALGLVATPAALVVLQPDLGTTIVLVVVSLLELEKLWKL